MLWHSSTRDKRVSLGRDMHERILVSLSALTFCSTHVCNPVSAGRCWWSSARGGTRGGGPVPPERGTKPSASLARVLGPSVTGGILALAFVGKLEWSCSRREVDEGGESG